MAESWINWRSGLVLFWTSAPAESVAFTGKMAFWACLKARRDTRIQRLSAQPSQESLVDSRRAEGKYDQTWEKFIAKGAVPEEQIFCPVIGNWISLTFNCDAIVDSLSGSTYEDSFSIRVVIIWLFQHLSFNKENIHVCLPANLILPCLVGIVKMRDLILCWLCWYYVYWCSNLRF